MFVPCPHAEPGNHHSVVRYLDPPGVVLGHLGRSLLQTSDGRSLRLAGRSFAASGSADVTLAHRELRDADTRDSRCRDQIALEKCISSCGVGSIGTT